MQFICGTANVVHHKMKTDVENLARELFIHMSHPGSEHWKSLRNLIGYLKGKKTKVIIIRKPKVLKVVMFSDSNYVTDKETKNISRGTVFTLVGTLPTCSSKTRRTVTLSSK